MKKLTGGSIQTAVKNGITIDIKNDTTVSIDFDNSKWINGNSNYIVQVGFDSRFQAAYQGRRIFYPADFEIQITEPGMGDLSYPSSTFSQPIQSNIIIKNITDGNDHQQFILEMKIRIHYLMMVMQCL
ncbi:MAG: hypothetical protein H6613_13130 [Ignavibacteriales bacterium]|nr:hypothetical protein [Ignavibacteriales bacterium]